MNQFRRLLFPFSLIYGMVTAIRNLLFDVGVFQSYSPPTPTIVVGNLSTGGTGKSPHVLYLYNMLHTRYKTAILSRGYGRKTKGFSYVTHNHTAADVGDEPLQFLSHIGQHALVAVCEKRVLGIQTILTDHPDVELILLDDAFQHRALKGGFQILLSDFNDPFFKDLVLPAGNLREFSIGKHRADCCVFTKCPEIITEATRQTYRQQFDTSKPVYFSRIAYGTFTPLNAIHQMEDITHIVLVTGIANPHVLIDHCRKTYEVTPIIFKDHHNFSVKDIHQIHEIFGNFTTEKYAIVTTDKDAMRLNSNEFKKITADYPWFTLPISIEIEDNIKFENEIINYVEHHKRSS